ncbi:hypothetical protein [Streptomyces sp. SAI-129]
MAEDALRGVEVGQVTGEVLRQGVSSRAQARVVQVGDRGAARGSGSYRPA